MRFLNALKKVNNELAILITTVMGSMACVWLFFAWSLLPLALPSWTAFCMYVSSTVIQLVALPMIMVGQKLLSKSAERREATDHIRIQGLTNQMATAITLLQEQKKEIAYLRAEVDKLNNP
jgi:hypothetical protein